MSYRVPILLLVLLALHYHSADAQVVHAMRGGVYYPAANETELSVGWFLNCQPETTTLSGYYGASWNDTGLPYNWPVEVIITYDDNAGDLPTLINSVNDVFTAVPFYGNFGDPANGTITFTISGEILYANDYDLVGEFAPAILQFTQDQDTSGDPNAPYVFFTVGVLSGIQFVHEFTDGTFVYRFLVDGFYWEIKNLTSRTLTASGYFNGCCEYGEPYDTLYQPFAPEVNCPSCPPYACMPECIQKPSYCATL